MADPYVRPLGHVEGLDGTRLHVGTDGGCVRVWGGPARFNREQAVTFAQLWVRACWEAGRGAERMAEEART
ncbi:MAG TPA: hypothetical protein VIX86_11395 [Streptosporangiaceae bacterium]